MNRISRLLHKITFLARQRPVINYSHKYSITDKDVQRAAKAKPRQKVSDDSN